MKLQPVEIIKGSGFTIWFRQPLDQLQYLTDSVLPPIQNPEISIWLSPQITEKEKVEDVALYYYARDYLLPELYQKIFVENIKGFTDFTVIDYVDKYPLELPFINPKRAGSLTYILSFFYYGFAGSDGYIINRKDLWDIINAVKFYTYTII